MTYKTEDGRGYLWVQTKVMREQRVKIPKWLFPILPIATAFEVLSRCE